MTLLAANEEVTWRARHFGITQHFTSRIMRFEPPPWGFLGIIAEKMVLRRYLQRLLRLRATAIKEAVEGAYSKMGA